MKLIVGLGNPDKEYNNTFHNLGFSAVDRAAEKLGVAFGKEGFACGSTLAVGKGDTRQTADVYEFIG